MQVVHEGLLLTSSLAPAVAAVTSVNTGGSFDTRLCLLSSSAEESAIFLRLSMGGVVEELLRLRLAAGA